MAGHQAPTMLYEDIYRIIIQAIVDENESLQNMACSSRLFATICRGHLFKRVRMDVNSREDLQVLNNILDHDSDVQRHVRQMTITDICPPVAIKKPATLRRSFSPPTYVDGYIQIKDDSSLMSSILARLENLHTTELLLRYTFSRNPPLRWEDLSSTIRFRFQQPQIKNINLEGVRCIPTEVSMGFLTMNSLRLSSCSFAPVQALSWGEQDLYRFRDSKITLSKFTFDWLPIDQRVDSSAETTTILHHWMYANIHHGISIPQLRSLGLSLRQLRDIEEAGSLLSLFQQYIDSVSINTTGLHLEALQLLPLYQAARESKLESSLSQIDIPYLISQNITTLADGWVTYDLQPISLRQLPSLSVRSLDLHVAHWGKHAVADTESNGEMDWVCNMLADLPEERAGSIEDLTLGIRVGSQMLKEKVFTESMSDLAESELWHVLKEALMQKKWSSLKSLSIKLDVSSVFFSMRVRDLTNAVMEHLRVNVLSELNIPGSRSITLQLERA